MTAAYEQSLLEWLSALDQFRPQMPIKKMMTSLGLKHSENTARADDLSCGKKKMSFVIVKRKKDNKQRTNL